MQLTNIILKFVFLFTITSHSCWANIDSLLKKFGDYNIGIVAINLDTNKIIYQKNPKRTFVPASVTKLFTSYAAIHYLGADYRYETNLLLGQQEVEQDHINGSVYLQFSGDPSLTYNNLEKIIGSLQQAKINEINGDFVIDETVFPKNDLPPGGFSRKDEIFCDAAPKTAMVINNNCTSGEISPAKLTLNNNAISVTSEVTSGNCSLESEYLGDNNYRIYGCLPANSKPIRLNYAVQNNKKMIIDYIKTALEQNKIKLDGNIVFGKSQGSIFYTHKSVPMSQLLQKVLHDSNNLYATNILRTVGAAFNNGKATNANGVKAIYALLKKHNIDYTNQLELHEGAGESVHNLVSPMILATMLTEIYKKLPSFITMLPQLGKEGTLKYRTIGEEYNDDVKAKTGSLTHVSSLAGYYIPYPGKKLAFAIMANGIIDEKRSIKELEEEILKSLINKGQ